MVFQGAVERGLVIEFHNERLPLGGPHVIWNGYLKFSSCKWLELLMVYIFEWTLLIHTFILDKMKGNLHRLTNSKMIEGKENGGRGLSSS